MTKRQSTLVMIAAIITLMLSLLDTNIVTAAAASIARDFGGKALAQVPWLVTAYALAETVAQPLYGRLADRYGVRPVLLGSIGLFLIGSLLCGLAGSMNTLVLLRVLQGLGAAGLLSVTFVLIGHMRAEAEDDNAATGNAMAGVMLGLGLICGPLLGGAIIAHVNWRWVFWFNVPLSLGVLAVQFRNLHLSVPAQRRKIDWVAASTLAAAAGALQLVCILGGHSYAWLSGQIIGLAAIVLMATGLFIYRQLTYREPFFPPYLFKHKILRGLTILQLTTGVGMAAAMVYLTLSLQLIRGETPFKAGLQLIPMALGIGAGSILGAVLLSSGRPLRKSLIYSAALSAVALGVLSLAAPHATLPLLWAVLAVLGFGVGIGLGNELIIVQSSVPLHDLGTATTGVRFIETLGTSAGATVFGLIFSYMLMNHGTGVGAISHAVTIVFALGAIVMVVATVVAMALPRILPTSRPQVES